MDIRKWTLVRTKHYCITNVLRDFHNHGWIVGTIGNGYIEMTYWGKNGTWYVVRLRQIRVGTTFFVKVKNSRTVARKHSLLPGLANR